MRETMFKFVARAVLLLTVVFGLLITLPLVLPREGKTDVLWVVYVANNNLTAEEMIQDVNRNVRA